MDNNFKIQYFDELFEIFSSQKEGWYTFYADYINNKVHWSQEIVDYLGLPARIMENDEALSAYISLIHPDDVDNFVESANNMLDGKTDKLNIFYRIKNSKGQYTTFATYSKFKRDEEGKPVFYAGTVINYEKNDLIEPTTGLFSTRQLIEDMDCYREKGQAYSLVLFSIRSFSAINSKYGYIIGNKVLRAIADIALLYKNEATVYRLEGTIFAMLKGFPPKDKSIEVFGVEEFDNIRDALQNGIFVDNNKILLDIYGGAVYTDENEIAPDTVYTSALFSLSKAKENINYDHLNLFNQNSLTEDRHKLSVYNEIRESIMNDCKGFYMVYQPIISKKTGKLISMEALLRWHGDDTGEVFPGTFIEWLEKDPIFYGLGTWILKKSLEDAKKIINRIPDFIVNVNLAYPQLERDDFEKQLKKIVDESLVSPKNIRLELTERCKLLDHNLLRKRMSYIQELGIQTSLDDFGTGYSAINLLFDMPVNQIKIDKSFINNIQNEKPKSIMLKAIVDSARALGAHVCVEGIETKEMADYVTENFNVTSLQGYYYSKPIPLKDFLEKMDKWM
ncbi:MAG: EAL domain-containing protein [Butyrivibrio sp.]|nr:EAL domain-containing protein [Butyrivibrio sp.]